MSNYKSANARYKSYNFSRDFECSCLGIHTVKINAIIDEDTGKLHPSRDIQVFRATGIDSAAEDDFNNRAFLNMNVEAIRALNDLVYDISLGKVQPDPAEEIEDEDEDDDWDYFFEPAPDLDEPGCDCDYCQGLV